MSQFNRTLVCSILCVLLGPELVACAKPETSSAPRDQRHGPIVQDEVPPLPDFRHYVVGSLAQPDAGTRDPFRERGGFVPRTQSGSSAPRTKPRPVEFLLRGIVERGGQRVALFRRGSVQVGESLAGWTVLEIGARSVTLERNRIKRRLSL